MNNQETIYQLERLKLTGMAERYKAMLALPAQDMPTVDEAVAMMAEAEEQYRENRRTERYLKSSHIRYSASVEGFEASADRNITKDTLLRLADCSFIRGSRNVLIEGQTGCGKSYLACALGRRACQMGYKVEYNQMSRFTEKVSRAKADGTFLKLLSHLSRFDLVIFDDWGLQPLDNNTRIAFLDILEEFYERKSIIVTSQLPVSKWHEYIGEPTLADAIMDRLLANAHRIALKGKSRRLRGV